MSKVYEFKSCMRKLPTGVTVITTKDLQGNNEGVTINTFTSVSLDPLLVLFNLKKKSFCYETFVEAKHFTINILAQNQSDVSNLFTKPGVERWGKVSLISETQTSSPALERCVSFLECEQYKLYDGGDHTIIVGRVINAVDRQSDFESLMYYNGGYFNPK